MTERLTTPEDVRSAYRLILGRDPENAEAILHWVREGVPQKDMVMTLLRSAEARDRFGDIFR